MRPIDFAEPDQSCDFVGPDQSFPDPGVIFVKGRGGGVGFVQARRPENSLDNVFFNPQLILQFTEGSNGFV